MSECKQIIIMRKDLKNIKGFKVNTGKLIASACHATLSSFLEVQKRDTAILNEWQSNGTKKICLAVNSLEELLELYLKVQKADIPCSLIVDNGLTEFLGPTITCIGIGPWPSKIIDDITGHLSLF